jgi:hypothetical protein
MIGTMTATEVRRKLRAALLPRKVKIDAWIDNEMAKLSDAERHDPRAVEFLNWLRESLHQAANEKNQGRDNSRPKVRTRSNLADELERIYAALRDELKEKKTKHAKAKKTNGKKKPAA